MSSLADMVGAVLATYAGGHAGELARSDEWMQVRDRYTGLSLNLIVNGHESLAKRVDREYQAFRNALRSAVMSPSNLRIADDYTLWESATEFQFTVKHLDRRERQITTESRVEAVQHLPEPKPSSDPPKRSWTQPDLDEAIREYKAKRSASFQQFISLLDNPKTPASRKRTIKKEAAAMFGRNVIAKALGVKSAKMVSQSTPWLATAEALGLPRRAGKGIGVRRRQTRIGEGMAIEQASMAATDTDEHAASDAGVLRTEREETLRQIRRLAESQLSEAKPQAKALFDRYQAGEMTDDQVRQTIELLVEPAQST